MRGLPTSPVRGLVVRASTFRSVARGSLLRGVADLLLRDLVIAPREPHETGKEP